MSNTDLDRCLKIGRMFICNQNTLFLDSQTSCLDALYSGSSPSIERRCDIRIILNQSDEVIQVDDHSFVVYLRGRTRLEFSCETYAADGSFEEPGYRSVFYKGKGRVHRHHAREQCQIPVPTDGVLRNIRVVSRHSPGHKSHRAIVVTLQLNEPGAGRTTPTRASCEAIAE